MARLPFRARLQPPTMGATTYTVPAGKFAVCNAFLVVPRIRGLYLYFWRVDVIKWGDGCTFSVVAR